MSSTTLIHSAPTSFRLAVPPAGALVGESSTAASHSATGALDPASVPLLSGVGGSAFILVFIACGLLIGAFTAVLTLRRLRTRRFTPAADDFATFDLERSAMRPPSPKFGEKPEMCDFRISVLQVGRRSSGLWRHMMPLSASEATKTSSPMHMKQKRASVSSVNSTYSQDSIVSVPLSPPPRYGLDLRRHSLAQVTSSYSPSISEKLRIAIPIAMPRPPPPAASSPHDVDMDKGGYFEYRLPDTIPEFCLGVTDVRYTKENEWMRRGPGSPC